ncbi:MAG: aminotransferase class I/II-fold pyridoxal phosphate-dependent enzyme [Myxococcales bacterium]|nr:MAG: aminotransferase class I/II-fold pyridoxal phosphate-dependent enzyme [Myxococcales bacterium]
MANDGKNTLGLNTRAVHAGEAKIFAHDAVTPPIVQTATYAFENTAELVAYMRGEKERQEYGRYGNPSVAWVEEKLANLEGAQSALLFSSGMAAVTSVLFALCKSGSHVVLFADCYRRTKQFMREFLQRFGVEHTLVPPGDIAALKAALRPETKLVLSEMPTNPYLALIDLEEMVAVCKSVKVKTAIDATFATPVNLRPLESGVDLVIHSASKYLAGHNDVLAGVVCGQSGLISLNRDVRDVLGSVCDPHAAYLVHRGIKTLPLRVQWQNTSALAVAEFLEKHPKIDRVWYPALPSHPDHALYQRYMSGGGGVVTFTVKGDGANCSHFIDAMRIPKIAPSLGGVESLIEQPALMSYFDQSEEQRNILGIPDNLVRFSVGLEDTEDLIADLEQALK